MKFSIIINRWAIFYFFIQNLSEWHFSNRKDYNILWREELGAFSIEEEIALGTFKKIRFKYKSSRTLFESAFFTAKNPWKDLRKSLPAEEYKTVKEIFDLFKNKFTPLWDKDVLLLIQWQKVLNKEINGPSLTNTITNILNILFNTSPPKKEVRVYVLFSTPNHTGGGANIDKNSISIEISRYALDGINHIVGVLWHETIHLLFQNDFFFPLVSKYFPKDQQTASLINESTVSALFPRGLLGIRLLNNKPPAILCPGLNKKQTIDILNLMKEYVDQEKHLDESYLEKILIILKIKNLIPSGIRF